MTYLQTEYFLSVAYTKSITRSAAELFVSPPAVSRQISLLEEELGFPLFVRSPRGMELTHAGEIMYNHFFSQKSAFSYAVKRARSEESAFSNDLHLGLMDGWGLSEQLHEMKAYFRERGTDLILHACFNPSEKHVLERGQLDAVISLGEDIPDDAARNGISMVMLRRIRKVFLYSSLIPLAKKPNLCPRDFAELPLVSFATEVRSIAQHENVTLCNELGFNPKMLVTDSLESSLMRVGIGDGFMIGDEWMVWTRLPDYAFLPIPAWHNIGLLWWNQNRNPALPALIEYCTQRIELPSIDAAAD